MQYALGHFLRFTQANGNVLPFQNFYIRAGINRNGYTHSFLPFGFSGVSINSKGDNVDSSLVLPNNELSRAWAGQAASEFWIATVDVCIVNPDDSASQQLLHSYTGAVSGGAWDETVINLTLNSVLDAVSSDIPNRSLHQRLVGRLPASSYVRF
jgi:hypothetical protein